MDIAPGANTLERIREECPLVFDILLPYQIEQLPNMCRCYDENCCSIEFSDAGTGKTYNLCALGTVKRLKLFVICPKPAVDNWYEVADLFDVELIGVSNYEAAKNGKYYASRADFHMDKRTECPYIIPVREGKKITDFEWVLPENALIVFDEAHRGNNHITINSQLLLSTKKYIGVVGAQPRLIIVSATIVERMENFRVVAYLLGIAQFGKHAYAMWLKRLQEQNPGKNIKAIIHDILFPKYGTRVRISNLIASDDPTISEIFKHDDIRAETHMMSPEAERDITAAYADIDAAITALKNKQQGEMCPLTIILRARQRIELLKVPTFVMLAMEWMSTHAVIIFVNFTETIKQLFERLDDYVQTEFGKFVTFIVGGQSVEDRTYNIESFRMGKSPLMLVNVNAGGECVSLHHIHIEAKPCVTLISPPDSGRKLKQTFGRIRRANALTHSIQRVIYCKGRVSPAGPMQQNDTTFGANKLGVEEMLAENLNKKLATMEFINNGDDFDLVRL